MPTAANRLNPHSSSKEVKNAISSCIEQLMNEGGRRQEVCVAICYSQAEKAIGRSIPRKAVRIG